jgi:mgtE-like transporter
MLFVSILPLVILLPALNDMIGSYGTIASAKFSTMIHEGLVQKRWWHETSIKRLLFQMMVIALITSLFSSTMAISFSAISGYIVSKTVLLKVMAISSIDVFFLMIILFLTSITAGLYFYKKGEDPNNLLIPITTSIADFGNMIILAVLVFLFF